MTDITPEASFTGIEAMMDAIKTAELPGIQTSNEQQPELSPTQERRQRVFDILKGVQTTAFETGVGDAARTYWNHYAEQYQLPELTAKKIFERTRWSERIDLLNRAIGIIPLQEFQLLAQSCKNPALLREFIDRGLLDENQVTGVDPNADPTQEMYDLIERTITAGHQRLAVM